MPWRAPRGARRSAAGPPIIISWMYNQHIMSLRRFPSIGYIEGNLSLSLYIYIYVIADILLCHYDIYIYIYIYISVYIMLYFKDGQTYPKRFLPELNKTQ